ncbi:homeobox domain-containing protein [Blakeslea trispora]|nr:homeobox domain-containing protein [Blakeslea trispora]
MENEDNRRGSLSISALLNDDSDPRTSEYTFDRSSSTSPVLSSGQTSPTTAKQMSSQLSKAKRKRISPSQYNRLMEVFDQTDTPSSEIRENLANELDMTKREVQVWFQNRRAKMNRSRNMTNSRRHSAFIPPPLSRTTSAVEGVHLPYHQHSQLPSKSQILPFAHVSSPYVVTPVSAGPPRHHEHHPLAYSEELPPSPPPTKHVFHHPYQRKPSAIDLLASAAEYVRTDRNETNHSKT